MLRKRILNIAYPFLKRAGKLHAPWTRKRIREADVEAIKRIAGPGDIILAHTQGEFTNICIPGFWKHAAMFTKAGKIIEAVDPVVREVGLYDFFMHKDYVAIVRPKLSVIDRTVAGAFCESFVGKPYDYDFDLPKGDRPNDAFYCAELPYWAYKMSCIEFKFELREVMGVLTIKPEDYYMATKCFSHIWDNSK